MHIFLIFYIVMNMVSFAFYGIDKKRAIKKEWRIPEKVLLTVALVGGSLGALIGMYFFHHKTKHWKFRIMVPLFMIVHFFLYMIFLRLKFL